MPNTVQTHTRDHDFMAACRRQFRLMLAQGVLPDIDAVIDAVLAGEAPSYYVEYEYTLRCLKRDCLTSLGSLFF